MNGIIKTIEWNKVCRLCLTVLHKRDVLEESSANNRPDPDNDHDHDHSLHHAHNIFDEEDHVNEAYINVDAGVDVDCGPQFSAKSIHSSLPEDGNKIANNHNDSNGDDDDDDVDEDHHKSRLSCSTICDCCDNNGSSVNCTRIKCSHPPANQLQTISNVPFHPTLLLNKRPKSCRLNRALQATTTPIARSPAEQKRLLLGEPSAPSRSSAKNIKLQQQQSAPDAAACDDSPHITVQMLHCLSIEVSRGLRGVCVCVYVCALCNSPLENN